jgi:hypothetical protein
MNFGTVSEGWDVPRHKHNFDQIRFPIAGEFEYAKDKILPAGWVGYFPEGVPYGPQVRRAGLVMLLLQFGGASGDGFLSKRQRKAAIDELGRTGTFEGGRYRPKDGSKDEDEYTAIWRHATGTALAYPEPRYEDLIMMNPASFAWIDDASQSGVARKHLGSFTERELRVGFVKIDKGATLQEAAVPALRLWFMIDGRVSHAGLELGPHTAIASEPGEAGPALSATAESTFLSVQLPRF